MQMPVKCAEGGFSLVEFMVAILILTIGLFALLTTVEVALKHNLSNTTRNNAVELAEQFLVNSRSVPYANLATLAVLPNSPVIRNVQTKSAFVAYTVITTVNPVAATNSSRVSVEVRWLERGDTGVADGQSFHAHSVSTLVTDTLAN
jgi:type IV pilus assembly protein PilV